MNPSPPSFLPQPPSTSPPYHHAPARPVRGAVASPSKSNIPGNNSRVSDSSILSTPINVKRRIPHAASTPPPGAECSSAHCDGAVGTPPPQPTDSPEPGQNDDALTPTNEWLGMQQPEPSPSPRCMSSSSSQRSRGNGPGVNRTSTVRAANSARLSGGRIAFGSSSMKNSSLSPPGPAKSQREQQQEQGGEQAHGQQQARPPSRGRETRGSMLRRSAVEERLKGIHSKQSGTFGSRPLNTAPHQRSTSNTRERPASASVNPPPAGAAGARVRPLSAPRVARSPSVARRPSSATASTVANAAAGSSTRSNSSIAASMRQSGSGSVVRQLANENPAHRPSASPARRSESNIGAGIAAATAAKAGHAGGAAHGGSHASILSSIPEKPAVLYPAKGAHGNKHAGAKPSFSLDLSSLKKEGTPSPLSAEKSATTPGSSGSKPSVPKLNLTPLLKEQEEHAQSVKEAYAEASAEAEDVPTAHEGSKLSNSKQGSAASHKKGGHNSGGGGGAAQKKAPPPEPPQDHFYFYPKMDPNDERKTMEAISRMPKPVQRHMRKIYDEMVEAKQNCEAIAFRGHRLLDQLQTHHKEKMEMREQEMARELQAYQAQAEETQRELQRIRAVLLARSNGETVGELGSLRGLHNHAGKWLFSDSPMAEISDGPDQAAYLGAQREAVDAMLQQVQGEIVSSRNEMSKLHASSRQQHILHGPPTPTSFSSVATTTAALTLQQAQPPATAAAAAAPSAGTVHVPKLNLGLASSPAPKSALPTATAAAAAAAPSTGPVHVPKLNLGLASSPAPKSALPTAAAAAAAAPSAGPVHVPKLNLGLASSPAPKSDPATAAATGAAAAVGPSATSTAAPQTAAGVAAGAGSVPKLNLSGLSHKELGRPVDLQVPKLNLGAMARIDTPTPSAHPPPNNPDMDAAVLHLQQQQQQQQQQQPHEQQEGASSCTSTPASIEGGHVTPPTIPKLELKSAFGHAASIGHPAPYTGNTGPAAQSAVCGMAPGAAERGSTTPPRPSADGMPKLDMGSAAAAAAAAASAVAAAARAEREARDNGGGGGAAAAAAAAAAVAATRAGNGHQAGAQEGRDDVVRGGGLDQAAGHSVVGDMAKQQDKTGKGYQADTGAGAHDDCRVEGDQQMLLH